MLLVSAALAAPPPLSVVAASDAAAPVGGAFVDLLQAGHTADGALIWKATVDDGALERAGFFRADATGAHALLEGDPTPDGGVFDSFSGVPFVPGGHAAWFVAAPEGPATLFAVDEQGARRALREGDPVAGGDPVGFFGIVTANARDEVLLRETVGDRVSLLLVSGGVVSRVVTFGEEIPGLPGQTGNRYTQRAELTDDGRVVFAVGDSPAQNAYAVGTPGALALVETAGWVPGGECCALVAMSPDGRAVFDGRVGAPPVGYLFEGPLPTVTEVLALDGDGLPVGPVDLLAVDRFWPVVAAPGGGFAFRGVLGSGAGTFTWRAGEGLAFVGATGDPIGGRPLGDTGPVAIGGDTVVLQDGDRVLAHTGGGTEVWLGPGDPVVHPIDGERPALVATFAGTSRDLAAGRVALDVALDDEGWVLLSTTTPGSPVTGGSGDGDGPPGDAAPGGCGCAGRSAGGGSAWPLVLVAAGLRRRPRR